MQDIDPNTEARFEAAIQPDLITLDDAVTTLRTLLRIGQFEMARLFIDHLEEEGVRNE